MVSRKSILQKNVGGPAAEARGENGSANSRTPGPATPLEFIEGSGIAALVVIVLAGVLYVSQISVRGFWQDEGWSVYAAVAQSLGELFSRMADDIHPPLYFALLRGWIDLWGTGEFATRSLSTLTGLCFLTLYYIGVRKVICAPAAFWSLLLLALSPFLQYHFINVRMYPLLILLEAAALFCAAIFMEKKDARWASGFAAAGLAAVYTHYLSFIFLFGFVAAGIVMNRRDLKTVLSWCVSGAVPVIGFLPWLKIFIGQSPREPKHLKYFNPEHFLYLLNTLNPWTHETGYLSWAGAGLLLILIIVGLRKAIKSERPIPRWIALSLAVTLAAFILGSFVKPFSNSRNVIIFVPLLAVFAGWAISSFKPLLRVALALVIIAVWAAVFPDLRDYEKPIDIRGTVAYLKENAGPADLVLLAPHFHGREVFKYYLSREEADAQLVFGRNVFITTDADLRKRNFSGMQFQRCYLVESSAMPAGEAVARLMDSGLSQKESRAFYGINVYRFERPMP